MILPKKYKIEQIEKVISQCNENLFVLVGVQITDFHLVCVDITDKAIREAILYLDKTNTPNENRVFFVKSDVFWVQIQKLDNFSIAINYPVQESIAYLYGIPVYLNTQSLKNKLRKIYEKRKNQ